MIDWFKKQTVGFKIMLFIGLFFMICIFSCCANLLYSPGDNIKIETPDIHDSAETSVIDVKETKAPEKTKNKSTPKVEIKTIAAQDIIKAYEDNEIAADQIYKNKTYKIKGFVDNISEMLSVLTVTMLGSDDFSITGITLYLKESDKPIVAKLSKGDEIIVQGTIEGKGWDVEVKDVKFIEY